SETPQMRPKSRGTGKRETLKSLFGSSHSTYSPSQSQSSDRPWSHNSTLEEERKSFNAIPNEKEVEEYVPTNPNSTSLDQSQKKQWQRNSVFRPSHNRSPSTATASSTLSHTSDYKNTLSFPAPRPHSESHNAQFVPDLVESEVDGDIVLGTRRGQ